MPTLYGKHQCDDCGYKLKGPKEYMPPICPACFSATFGPCDNDWLAEPTEWEHPQDSYSRDFHEDVPWEENPMEESAPLDVIEKKLA